MAEKKEFKDLTKLPRKHWPTIDELPGELANVARIIDSVAPGKGVEAVMQLEKRYESVMVYIHTLDPVRRRLRNRWIIERYTAGEKVSDIARDVGLSSRQIWTILGRDPDNDRQLKLF